MSVWEKRGETELRWMLADVHLLMQDKGNDYVETVVISCPRSMLSSTVRCLQDQTPSAVSWSNIVGIRLSLPLVLDYSTNSAHLFPKPIGLPSCKHNILLTKKSINLKWDDTFIFPCTCGSWYKMTRFPDSCTVKLAWMITNLHACCCKLLPVVAWELMGIVHIIIVYVL